MGNRLHRVLFCVLSKKVTILLSLFLTIYPGRSRICAGGFFFVYILVKPNKNTNIHFLIKKMFSNLKKKFANMKTIYVPLHHHSR